VEIATILGLLGGILSMIGYVPYWRSIFLGPIEKRTRPQRASWLIWIFSDVMILATSFKLGATDSLWVPLAYVIGTIITFVISINKGEGGAHWFDYLCLGVTFLSFLLWIYTGDPFQSLIINLSIVAVGTIPTILKIMKDPYSENLTGFSFWGLGSLCSLLAVLLGEIISVDIWIQPLWFLALQVIIVPSILILRLRR
jgi:hypothetical protein